MKTMLAIGLCVAGILTLFLIGRSEKARSQNYIVHSAAVIAKANQSLDDEIATAKAERTPSAVAKTEFLLRQKRILAAAPPGPIAHAPAAAQPYEPGPTPIPVAAARETSTNTVMSIVVTAIVGGLALWLILSTANKPDDDSRKWAFGILGTLVGFWLK